MKPSTRRELPLSRANKELPEGPNRLWLTIILILNILIFTGFGYMIWDMTWDFE